MKYIIDHLGSNIVCSTAGVQNKISLFEPKGTHEVLFFLGSACIVVNEYWKEKDGCKNMRTEGKRKSFMQLLT